jgi:hypothetical protein
MTAIDFNQVIIFLLNSIQDDVSIEGKKKNDTKRKKMSREKKKSPKFGISQPIRCKLDKQWEMVSYC